MKTTSVSDWIENRAMRGDYTFTKEEVGQQFPTMGKDYMKIAINRQIAKRKIISPWHNFYVIMPTEFALKGVIPPVFYMDQLMSFLGKQYYVSLLNAAAFYGAAHQRVQTFSVMVELPQLRSTSKNDTTILFFSKKQIQTEFIIKHKTQSGYINVSSPELTALDLIAHEKHIGGLNRVCTVLNELNETFALDSMNNDFFSLASTLVFQKFGYILECILNRKDLADILFQKMNAAGLKLRKTPLKSNKPTMGCDLNKKWKIILNQEIDIDE